MAVHPDGSVEFEIDVVANFELYSVLRSYGAGIVVLSPRTVRRQMVHGFKSLLSLYENPPVAPTK